MTHKQDTDRDLCEAAKNAEWIGEKQRDRADKAEAALAAALAANRDWKSELAGLKARMKPCAQVVGGEVRAFMDPDDEGKYVAVLVVEE